MNWKKNASLSECYAFKKKLMRILKIWLINLKILILKHDY